MALKRFSTQCKQWQCSQCQGDTEFYCNTCEYELCIQCKERHINLYIKDHDFVLYHEKYQNLTKQESCKRHPDKLYDRYCLSCEVPVCVKCTVYRNLKMLTFSLRLNKHRKHEMVDLRTAYETNRRKYREIIHKMRSDIMYNSCHHLTRIKTDLKFFHTCNIQSEMSVKARRLKELIDNDVKSRIKSLKIQKPQQIRKLKRHIYRTENYEYKFEQSVNKPIKFLLFLKKTTVPKTKESPFLTHYFILSLTEKINREDVITLLSEIQLTETEKRKVGIHSVLKLMFTPVLHKSMTVTSVDEIRHISRESSDRFWISDRNNIVLINTAGDNIHQQEEIGTSFGGHTVDIKGDLIYIDRNLNIIKLSKDNRSKSILIKQTENWIPLCVFCTPSNGLLVGLRDVRQTSKVVRYDYKGKHIHTIQHDDKGQAMYGDPNYITENRNGDVVVSDWPRAVVVTDRGRRHRFYYRGHPPSSGILPQGICTGAMSNILVCDALTDAVHIIDQDGHFLSLIQTQQLEGINTPWNLCYEDKTHLLWVGSWTTTERQVILKEYCTKGKR